MKTEKFPETKWAHNGDADARSRVLRVLDHHRINFWQPDESIRFVTMDEQVVADVERAIDGYDASCVLVNDQGRMMRRRIEFDS